MTSERPGRTETTVWNLQNSTHLNFDQELTGVNQDGPDASDRVFRSRPLEEPLRFHDRFAKRSGDQTRITSSPLHLVGIGEKLLKERALLPQLPLRIGLHDLGEMPGIVMMVEEMENPPIALLREEA